MVDGEDGCALGAVTGMVALVGWRCGLAGVARWHIGSFEAWRRRVRSGGGGLACWGTECSVADCPIVNWVAARQHFRTKILLDGGGGTGGAVLGGIDLGGIDLCGVGPAIVMMVGAGKGKGKGKAWAMIKGLTTIEVITLFVEDLVAARGFYGAVLGAEVVCADDACSVMNFDNILVNVLAVSEPAGLVTLRAVASAGAGSRGIFTIKVADTTAVCADFSAHGVTLLNGPLDQPWVGARRLLPTTRAIFGTWRRICGGGERVGQVGPGRGARAA